MPARERRSGVTKYDRAHVTARAAAARRHHPDDPCSRCGYPLGPMSPSLHWDHDDQDPTRTTYRGFSHQRCNTRAGAIKGNRARARQRTWNSRTW